MPLIRHNEAEDMFCPFRMMAYEDKYPYCKGVNCMMWRVEHLIEGERKYHGYGYCGLAGKPRGQGE